jgi:hypothetical protein
MPSQQLVHVVNAGLGPDGQQRCRRCKEAMPALVRGLGYSEGRVLVSYSGDGVVLAADDMWPIQAATAPECIALNGTPAHA